MYFIERCILRRSHVPIIPCDQKKCDWYVREGCYNNCFWVLANCLKENPVEMGFEEIADLEGMSVGDIKDVYASAVINYRKKVMQNQEEDVDI